ncbi:hypothetical protein M8C21_022841, partial [Ambrosia artemisiifolia]
CPLLNIMNCPPTEADISSDKKLVASENLSVYDSNKKEVESQFLPIINESISIRNYHTTAYTASAPPLGFSTYTISSTTKPDNGTGKDDIEIGTGNLKLIYSRSEGKLSHYVNTRSSIKASLKQSYSFYAGFDGTTGLQAS